MSNQELSLQDKYAAKSICYGCGPANQAGLHIKSFPKGDEVVGDWEPDLKYQAFPGMLYGGLIGCLLDCHCNWTASWHLMQQNKLEHPPCTVTAKYSVKFLKPTPANATLHMVAKVIDSKEDRATVSGELRSADMLCATFEGTFVAVKEGHPAYHRW
ncbi:MAG: PaaI family thioesterase [Candidatus Obscuribacterales bacterium]|nr:PaaI family thioesterase [Candidatus Obscuribacterales bacterium]